MSSPQAGYLRRAGQAVVVTALILVSAWTMPARAQTTLRKATVPESLAASQASMTPSQIVEQLQLHNKVRADGLKHYKSLRHYAVEYKGYSAKVGAMMDVEAEFDAVEGKSFKVVSQSGSKALVDKVLKRLLESEKEAGSEKRATALSEENYKFRLMGIENLGDRPAFMLEVEPKVDSKYLYRGRIWIDAADFAVAKIEAEPAKNPSFWISKTAIKHLYGKTSDFWLPVQNRSETKVRVGGTAVLTIDYGTYEVIAGTQNARSGR